VTGATLLAHHPSSVAVPHGSIGFQPVFANGDAAHRQDAYATLLAHPSLSKYGLTRDRAKSRIGPISVSVRVLVLGVLVSAGGLSHAAEPDVWELRKELAAARDATDNPAIIELSRRIVEVDPRDSMAWEMLHAPSWQSPTMTDARPP
jgi:hypothetical protein